jgi:hypothetical protein
MGAIRVRSIVVIALLVSLWPCSDWEQVLRALGFNIDSGGALPEVVDDFM